MIRRTCLSREERIEIRKIIREKTGYLMDISILDQIFRRSSFAAETGENSNEIFEFIGDQVLNYYVVKIIAKKCGSFSLTDGYTFRIRENQFTQIKQSFVNNDTLAKIIDEWDIAKYLLLGKCDIKNNVVNESKVKADLFEAIIGAIAVKSNWDSAILEAAISKALDIDTKITSMIESDYKVQLFDIDNAISALKEMAEKGYCTMPNYKFTGPDFIGYDSDGNPKWSCTSYVVSDKTGGVMQQVLSTSKKDAKKAVAYLILCELLGVQNKYGPNHDGFSSWIYKEGKLYPDPQFTKKKE